MFGCDLHGDMQDAATVDSFLRFTKAWKPRYRIFGGDLFDFRPLRRKAEEDERRQSMQSDVEAGIKFINQWKPTHYLRGNHCERLWDLARFGSGILADYAKHGTNDLESLIKRTGCFMLPYHKRIGIVTIGKLSFLHGYSSGVYAAKATAMVYGSCLFGHIHAFDQASVPGIQAKAAQSVGCMCSLDMDYNLRQPGTLRQQRGWAYGVINDKTGDYSVWLAKELNGTYLVTTQLLDLGQS